MKLDIDHLRHGNAYIRCNSELQYYQINLKHIFDKGNKKAYCTEVQRHFDPSNSVVLPFPTDRDIATRLPDSAPLLIMLLAQIVDRDKVVCFLVFSEQEIILDWFDLTKCPHNISTSFSKRLKKAFGNFCYGLKIVDTVLTSYETSRSRNTNYKLELEGYLARRGWIPHPERTQDDEITKLSSLHKRKIAYSEQPSAHGCSDADGQTGFSGVIPNSIQVEKSDLLPGTSGLGNEAVLAVMEAHEDVPVEKCVFYSYQDILSMCEMKDIVNVYHPDNKEDDIKAILKIMAILSSHSVGVSVSKSIEQTKKAIASNPVIAHSTTADMDSLIFTYCGLDAKFSKDFSKLLGAAEANQYTWSVLEDTDHVYCDVSFDMHTDAYTANTDIKAKLLVDIIYSNALIQHEKAEIVDFQEAYLPVGKRNVKKNIPTIGYSKRVLNLFALPAIMSSEPVHAFVVCKDIHSYKRCVLRIGWYINQYYPTSVQSINAAKMLSSFPTYVSEATCVGGLWIFRLAFMLYLTEFPRDESSRYIEETYNMKKRGMSAAIRGVERTLFNGNAETSLVDPVDDCAKRLSNKIISGGGPQVTGMFSHYYQGFLTGVFNIGIGIQTGARVDNTGAELYLCQSESILPEHGSVATLHYGAGASGEGFGGFTQANVFSVQIINNSTKVETRPKQFTEGAKAAMTTLHDQRERQQAFVALLVRTQTYYTHWRYHHGGCEIPYVDRIATKVKLLQGAENDSMLEIKPAKIVGHLKQYSKILSIGMESLRENGPGYRSEMAFACNGFVCQDFDQRKSILSARTKVRMYRNLKQFRDISESEPRTLDKIIHEVLLNTIGKALRNVKENVRLVDCNVVAKYSSLVLSAHLFAYFTALNALLKIEQVDSDTHTHDRIAICLFVRYIQDFLAIFLRGSHRSEYTGVDDYNKKPRVYKYQVFLYDVGKRLKRVMFPTPPKLLVDSFRIASDGNESLISTLSNAGLIRTKAHLNVSSWTQAKKFEDLWDNGRPASQVVLECSCADCKQKYFYSNELLQEHLCQNATHRGQPRPLRPLTAQVFQHIYNHVLSTCSEEQKPIVEAAVRFGENCIVSGNGGTGKSVLMKKILQLLWLRENDGIPGTPSHAPCKVLGAAMQQLQAQNANKSFTTVHRLLGISEKDIPYHSTRERRIQWAHEHLLAKPDIKTKFRKCEVIILEEFGMVPNFVGILLETLVNVARGRIRLKDSSYGSSRGHDGCDDHNDKEEEEDDDEDDKCATYDETFPDTKLHAVQLYFNGQATQLPPISSGDKDATTVLDEDGNFKSATYAINENIHAKCNCFHLITPFRSDGKAQEEIKGFEFATLTMKARVGRHGEEVKVDDSLPAVPAPLFDEMCIDYVIERAGKKVKEMIGILNFANDKRSPEQKVNDFVQVTHVVFTHNELYHADRDIERELFDRGAQFQVADATDSLVPCNAASKKLFKDAQLAIIAHNPTRETEIYDYTRGTFLEARCSRHDGKPVEYFPVFPTTKLNPDYHMNRTFEKVGPKRFRIFIGMPVIVTDNFSDVPVHNPSHSGLELERSSLAKNTQGVIISYDSKNVLDPTIIIGVDAIQSDGLTVKQMHYVIKRKIVSGYVSLGDDGMHGYTLTRQQFPLKTGMCISWNLVQGLTIPYLCLDFNRNKHLINAPNGHVFHALWYVTLSRVRNIDCILLQGLKSSKEYGFDRNEQYRYNTLRWRFFQSTNKEAVEFEAKFIRKAALTQTQQEICKGVHKITILKHMQARYNADRNVLAPKSELVSKHYDLAVTCTGIVNVIQMALRPPTSIHPNVRMLQSKLLQDLLQEGSKYSEILSEHVNPSMYLIRCFLWLTKFCKSECQVFHNEYTARDNLVTFASSNPAAGSAALEFRFLLCLSDGTEMHGIEDDVRMKVEIVVSHIKFVAEQALVSNNPTLNPVAFINACTHSSKRSRGSEDSEFPSSFATEHYARFRSSPLIARYKTLEEEKEWIRENEGLLQAAQFSMESMESSQGSYNAQDDQMRTEGDAEDAEEM